MKVRDSYLFVGGKDLFHIADGFSDYDAVYIPHPLPDETSLYDLQEWFEELYPKSKWLWFVREGRGETLFIFHLRLSQFVHNSEHSKGKMRGGESDRKTETNHL